MFCRDTHTRMEKKEFKAKVIMETQLDSEGVASAEGVVKETTHRR